MRDTRVDLTLASGGGRTPFLTYEPYYGLKEKPFSLSSDPRFLYKSRAHASVFDDIRAGVRRREGVIVLTGDIGTGKTTLCRAVLEGLDRKTFCTIVPDPFVSREDLLKMLLVDFGVISIDDLTNGRLNGASRPELSYPLYDFLKSLVPLQAFAVLIIDEAQNLPLPLLEELRILSDLEGPEKLLQVVLIGQLEFLPKLKDPKMRQLDQRVSVRCELHALDREGVAGYISHRLTVAGCAPDRVNFSPEAVDLIYKGTYGNPRLINLTCDKSLHHGHLTRTVSIGPDLVRQALRELGITKLTPAPQSPHDFGPHKLVEPPEPAEVEPAPAPKPIRAGTSRWIAAGLAGVFVGALLLFGWQVRQNLTASLVIPTPPAAPAKRLLGDVKSPAGSKENPALAGGERFEVGVALFAGHARALRLAVELADAGYQASTRSMNFTSGRMHEVRTGPYATREAAEADAARIRAMPGYADARVIPPPTAPQ